MKRLNLLSLLLLINLMSCNRAPSEKKDSRDDSLPKQMKTNNPVAGTWIRHSKEGFTQIEILDTNNINYWKFIDRKAFQDTITFDRYWYYKSKATMGWWNKYSIWISTDMFRFDFKIQGDSLVEFGKSGDEGTFVRVLTDEQKNSKK